MPVSWDGEANLNSNLDSSANFSLASSQAISLPINWPALITEGFEEALFSVNHNWRFTWLNSKAAEFWKRSPESLIGKSMWEEFPTLKGSRFENYYQKVMGEGKPLRFEEYSPTTKIWYEVQVYPIAEGLVVYFRDVTERKQLQLSLQESEAMLSGIINSATDAIISLDEAHRIVIFNPAAEGMFGCTAQQAIGQSLDRFMPPSLRERHRQNIENFGVSGITSRSMFDEFVIHAVGYNGEEFPIEATISQAIVNGHKLYTAIIRDITERQQKKQQLRESEERFRILSEGAFDAVIIQENGWIVDVNQAAVQMTGYTREELVNMHISDLATPESKLNQQRLGAGYTGAFEGQALRKDGTVYPIEGRRQQVMYKGRAMFVTSARNIAPQKDLLKAQEQLLQAQKVESIGRLAGGIAHDFNNLLTVITNYCDLGQLLIDDQERVLSAFDEIQTASKRAAELTHQLLAFSRRQVLQPKVVDLNQIVTNADKMLQRLIGEDIELKTIPDPLLAKVMVDPGQIEQILVNLVVNARDAINQSSNGKITIETSNVELDENYHYLHNTQFKAGSYVMLAVSDNGVGMDEATQAKIFEPFFTTKEPGKGTGLGLATVFGIVKQSEGYIWVYSRPGFGTTFKIYLPAVEVSANLASVLSKERFEAALPEVELEPEPVIKHDYTILVVEDESAVRELIKQILEQAGYKVITVHNGKEALACLSQSDQKIDLLLTDTIMPQMGGYELIIELGAYRQNLKVIGMSGYTDMVVQHHKLLENYDAFLQKPFTRKLLLRCIEKTLADNYFSAD